MRQEIISQVIPFSSPEIFDYYRQKYSVTTVNYFPGLCGIEVRNLPDRFDIPITHFKCKDSILLLGVKESRLILKDNLLIPGLDLILDAINKFINYHLISYKIKSLQFSSDVCYCMGVINITADSFSDGGKNFNLNSAVDNALKMIDSGVDIIDIGGESTRPGSSPVSEEEELHRVLPVVQKVLKLRPSAIISVDTTKCKVADRLLDTGAAIINDVSGLSGDAEKIEILIKYNASIIIMHMKGTPQNMQVNPEYKNVVEEVYDFLFNKSELVRKSGINNVFIDPGIGFGKNVNHNLHLINQLESFKSIGAPIVIGVSRKSMFEKLLNLKINERENATSVLNTIALMKGARIIRTHNVEFGLQTCKLLNSLIKSS